MFFVPTTEDVSCNHVHKSPLGASVRDTLEKIKSDVSDAAANWCALFCSSWRTGSIDKSLAVEGMSCVLKTALGHQPVSF